MRVSVFNILSTLGVILLMVVLIGFTGARNDHRAIHDVVVDIEQEEGNYFVDQAEVIALLNAANTDYVLGSTIGRLELKLLESRVEAHPFVDDADVFYDLHGNLRVTVEQARPIARLFDPRGTDRYIDRAGHILPTDAEYTARVPLIETERPMGWEESLLQNEQGRQLLEFLTLIDADPFWRAQIAHLVIEKGGDYVMFPQVTKQKIIFGQPEDLDSKLRRLEIFYKEILPKKGWNHYSSVNLKIKDQIVCE